ncbi:MAG: ABC transporter permease [Caldilineaceae bacterium SB0668_bin_21]|nr:ABC transporter permease [Caldilineaceae bacterium SB0668_bin_21]MYC22432.1 ABC transporter permease [Caldilineaceae bacterium SB0662_bin_25]
MTNQSGTREAEQRSSKAIRDTLASELDRPESGQRGLWSDAFRRLLRNRLSLIGLIIVILTYATALAGPYLAPYDYLDQNLEQIGMPPNAEHWLGTDDVGRDYFSRLLHAMRTAVLISILVPLLTLVIGVTLGTVSAYSGRAVDNTIMRLADVVMTIPTILFAALINASIAEPLEAVMAALQDQTGWRFLTNTVYVDYLIVFSALSLISWPGEARLIRGQILSLREQDYVLAARAVGATNKQIMLRHLVPNSLGPVIVSFTFSMSSAMILEASLSYLGIGIQPPGASLGSMINRSMPSWRTWPHLIAIPAIVLGIVTLAINFLGDGLNDALNPRQAGN